MITITISGEQQEFVRDDFRIDKAIDERSTCKFTVTDWSGDKTFHRGQPVAVYEGEGLEQTLIYGGIVEKARRHRQSAKAAILHEITCIDWHYLTDKRIVARGYEQNTPGQIVTALHTEYLAEEGITLGDIDQGEVIELVVFNYISAARAIGALKEAANFWWRINPDKSLDFVRPEHYSYPDPITWEDMIGDPQMEEGNPKYRNRQFIRGARDLTGEQVETKAGDGKVRDFVLGYRAGTVPTFEVSYQGGPYIEEHRGIKGLDQLEEGTVSTDGTAVFRLTGSRFMPGWEGRAIIINAVRYIIHAVTDDANLVLTETAGAQAEAPFVVPRWYWEKYSETVTQDREIPIMAEGDLLRITYRGIIDIMIRTQDNNAIEDLKEIEGGGTGYVEAVDQTDIPDRQTAFDIGAGLLAKYSKQGRTVKFKTLKSGIEPGHLATIDLPEYYLAAAEMLIEAVTIYCASPTELAYNVKAVEGPTHGSWTRFFGELATRGEALVIRENISEVEVLILLFEFSKNWAPEPSLNNIMERVTPGEAVFPGSDLYPMFDYNDRLKFVEWKVGGAITGRKQLTDKEGITTDEMDTFVYLAPYEGNGAFQELHWYGGIDAAAGIGTGIKVVSESFAQTKTTAEGWDIRRKDRWDES